MTQQRLVGRVGHLLAILVMLSGPLSGAVASSAQAPAPPETALIEATTGPPDALDVAGPPSAMAGQATLFTATVEPSTVSVPITFTWETDGYPPFSEVTSDELSVSETFTWDEAGTHTLTVTATNAEGSVSRVRKVWIEPPPQPDLIVTDIRYDQTTAAIYYQFMNTGDQALSTAFTARVYVGDAFFDEHVINKSLAPGERLTRMVSGAPCVGDSSAYRVALDVYDDVPEREEANNERTETWRCDTQAPAITRGPGLLDLSQTEATIRWDTDEASDSEVLYDTRKGAFGMSASNATLTTTHEVTLTGLRAGVTYEYKVRSADAAGNAVESRPGTLETLAAPTAPLSEPALEMRRDLDRPGFYLIEAEFDDASAVEKVEFLLNGEVIGTDYGLRVAPDEPAASALAGAAPQDKLVNRYKASFQPLKTGYTRATFLGHAQQVTAQVYGWDSSIVQVKDIYTTPATVSEPISVTAEISSPPPDHKIYITDPVTPFGTALYPTLYAEQYDLACQWTRHVDVTNCNEVKRSVARIQLLFDGHLVWEVFPDEDTYGFIPYVNAAGLAPDEYWLEMLVWDTDGVLHYRSSPVQVVQQVPTLDVTRQVDRVSNLFRVRLTVQNVGVVSAALAEVTDYVRSFQVLTAHAAGLYRVFTDYDSGTGTQARVSAITIDFYDHDNEVYPLSPGQSVVLEYWLAPVLYETAANYQIGQKSVKVHYVDGGGLHRLATFSRQASVQPSEVALAHTEASQLIVTHPGRLNAENDNSPAVDELLMTMAEMAYQKRYALGYLQSEAPREILDTLVSASGAWALAIDPLFNTLYHGALLIVGENNIVPAWNLTDPQVELSDQPYSDTGGTTAPDLAVGRIIGNTAQDLIKPLRASLDVSQARASFDLSHAWLLSGGGGDQEFFGPTIDQALQILYDSVGITGHDAYKAFDYHDIGEAQKGLQSSRGFAAGRIYLSHPTVGIVAGFPDLDRICAADPTAEAPGLCFGQTYDVGDLLAVGDLFAGGDEEIVMADASSGQIHVFGSGLTISLNPGPAGFQAGDLLALWSESAYVSDSIVLGHLAAGQSPGRVSIYSLDGQSVPGVGFEFPFDQYDRLAVGNVSGGSEQEIVIADSRPAADRPGGIASTINVFSVAGAPLAALQYRHGSVAQIAVGNVTGPVSATRSQIVVLDHQVKHILVYKVIEADGTLKEAHRMYLPWLEPTDVLALGDVTGDAIEEILIGSPSRGTVTWLDTTYGPRMLPEALATTPGKDILIFNGHGTPSWWDVLDGFPNGFGVTRPLAFAASCLTGNYGGGIRSDGIAEAFFDRKGAVYIGATEVSWGYFNAPALHSFLEHWNGGYVGTSFLQLERRFWGASGPWGADIHSDDSWYYWVNEYNLYGDPTFRTATAGAAADADIVAASVPPETLILDLPELTVESSAGVDRVSLAGGSFWLVEGEPQVPIWQAIYEYPAGTRVQDVALDVRSGLEEHTGWVLPLSIDTNRDTGAAASLAQTEEPADAWVPPQDVPYFWQTFDNPDGSTTLSLVIYPFSYHPLSVESRYYRHYEFTITTTTAALAITHLATGQPGYEPGDLVTVDLRVQNDDPELDVVVEGEIRTASGAPVAGLLLRSLHSLGGAVTFAPTWDSTGTPPGDYRVAVTLRDAEGAVLDREDVGFRLGTVEGEVTALTVDPTIFARGPLFDISLAFTSTGTVPITGTAIVEVYARGASEITAVLTAPLEDVAPGATATFDTTWDATGVAAQDYRVRGKVQYNGWATPPLTIDLPASLRLYLPVSMKLPVE